MPFPPTHLHASRGDDPKATCRRQLHRFAVLLSSVLSSIAVAQGVPFETDGLGAERGILDGTGIRLSRLDGLQTSPTSWFSDPYGGPDERPRWKLPTNSSGDLVLRRVAYPVDAGSLKVVPTVVYLPDSGARMPGVVAIGLERPARDDPIGVRGELAWSGKPGGSMALDYNAPGRQVSVKGDERPGGVATLPGARAPGSNAEGSWAEQLTGHTTATLTLTNDRVDLDSRDLSATTGRIEIAQRASDNWSLVARLGSSAYGDFGSGELRRGTVALGTSVDLGTMRLTALYRDVDSSLAARPGHGGRLTLSGSHEGVSASVFADVQQQAATFELNVQGSPDLPTSISELGLVVADPDAAFRTARDFATAMNDHGVALGAMRIDPLRVQGGVDLRWRQGGAYRTELGARLRVDGVDGYAGPRRAMLGTLYASWQLFRDADITASYASWNLQRDSFADDTRSAFRLAVRAPL